MARILITNDDGIVSPALEILKTALEELGEVFIVAPERPMNAMGNSITLHKPVRVKKIEADKYSVSGTPADCVRTGVLTVMGDRVDLVVSGINDGGNLGDDVRYSGTVAGAKEAASLGIPSMASSLITGRERNFRQAAGITLKVARRMLSDGLPERKILNLNVPDLPDGGIGGVRVTRLGERIYDREVRERTDPLGRKYYWILGEKLDGVAAQGTDFEAVSQGFASLTPVTMDYTDYELLPKIESWNLS